MLSHFSCVWLCVTLWTAACQASLSVGFSRQEYCSGLLCPPPGDLPDLGVEPASLRSNLHWQVVSLPLVHTWEAPLCIITYSLLADMKLTQEHIFSWLLWGCQSWLKVSQYTTVNTVVNLSPQTTKKKTQLYFSFYVWKTDGWCRQCLRSLPTWRFCLSIFGQTGKTWFKPI